jgi:hypothetical protein
MHEMMAEYAKQCGAAMNFKKDLILHLDILARWTENN